MRTSTRLGQCFAVSTVLRLKVPNSPQEEKEHFERMEQEAKARGFGRRDSGDDKVFMDKTFSTPEKVDGVAIANLPPKVKEETAFTQYERSSTEFTSIVLPHNKESSALGAGFGARPDKRLGFLRPRQTLQPFTGAASSVVPKYDENGMPVDDTLSRDQMMKKRMEYLRSIEGTTMSRNEHFLLADLDFEKDAVLFGNTREEFERNVLRLKNVILTYNKWERTDNFYYYSTIILKIAVVWVLIECIQQYYDLCLFEKNYDVFSEVMEKEIAELADKREKDLATAREQLRAAKPDFAPVIAAMMAERDRIAESTRAMAAEEQSKRRQTAAATATLTSVADLASTIQKGGEDGDADKATASPARKSFSALDPVTNHPMDTMGDAEYAERQAAEEQRQEMQRLYETTAKPGHFSLVRSAWRKLTGGSTSAPLSQPLQQEDFVRFSYAASPTSVEAMRAIRRTLLPRSEDYTQVVREEMLAYKREKDMRVLHPSSEHA